MLKTLLILAVVISTSFTLPKSLRFLQPSTPSELPSIAMAFYGAHQAQTISASELKAFLKQQAGTLNPLAVNSALAILSCVKGSAEDLPTLLTVIDYSLPSNQKRLWVFDIEHKKLLFHTYVSHGIRSGELFSNFFSNKNNSKTSSIGVYKTDKSYYGREGISLQLQGLENHFNDNASTRSLVMHGGWYVEENFIKKYGRAGRSWGCPALPPDLAGPIINTIKNKSVLFIYYPSEDWFAKSHFLNCKKHFTVNPNELRNIASDVTDSREAILFADLKNHHHRSDNDPVMAIAADDYQQLLHTSPPLKRMLRRQIDHKEYIALTANELSQLKINSENLNKLVFVIPQIIMVRGYYETQMKPVNLGKVKDIHEGKMDLESGRSVSIKSTDEFIRWVGL